MSDYLRQIQGSINERQQELHHIADLLARKALRASWRSAGAKTAVVILGAFAATRGAADKIMVDHPVANLVTYTIAGLLVAAVAGLDAAFKFDRTAVELRQLASICHSTVRDVDTQWQSEIGAQVWVLGTGAQWRELPKKYPPYQTCHRRFQQWVREGKLEGLLRVLAEELYARGKLQLEEAFIDASFTGAKKGAARSGPPSAARGRKSSRSPMITVFLSPLVSKALRRMKVNLSKGSWGTASSTLSPRD